MPVYSGEYFTPLWVGHPLQNSPYDLQLFAALLRDDGPIGQNTVIATKSQIVSYDPYSGAGIEFGWPDEYDGMSPVSFRIRVAVYSFDRQRFQPTLFWPYDLARLDAIRICVTRTPEDGRFDQSDPLPLYDPSRGSVHNTPLFPIPSGFTWAPEQARMATSNGDFVRFFYYDDFTYEGWYFQDVGYNSNAQQPHEVYPVEGATRDGFVYEIEYAEHAVPQYVTEDDYRIYWRIRRWVTLAPEVYYHRADTGEWEPQNVITIYHPEYQYSPAHFAVQVTFSMPSWKRYRICVHGIDSSSLLVGQRHQIRHTNLFSGTMTQWSDARVKPIVRVRHQPRFHCALVLLSEPQSNVFRVDMVDLRSNARWEVVLVTGTNPMIEIAEDQRTALLVYLLSGNSVYRRISRDGGWTWEAPQQCTLSDEGNLVVQVITDLDYSPRRRCWFLAAQTDTYTFKVYASEDGLVWEDTGL